MKHAIILFLMLVSANLYSQKLVRYGMFAASIVANGIGDGMNDKGKNKVLAHGFKAASVGLLLTTPLILKEKQKPLPYITSFILLRYAVFDASYNAARGLPYNYTGTSSVHDNTLARVPKSVVTGSKILSLGLSIYINNKH